MMKIICTVLCLCCVLAACVLAACTPAGPRAFSDAAFSFSYPADWQPMAELFPNYQSGRDYYKLGFTENVMVTSVQEQGGSGAYFAVATQPLALGASPQDVFDNTYAQIAGEITDPSESIRSLAGVDGYEMRYRRPWGEPWWQFQDIWLEKDGVIYLLSAHANNLETYQEALDSILESFTFDVK
jgi:hypothetical protein